jgi:hypothetical protein
MATKTITLEEELALSKPGDAYYYACDVIKGRWPPGEPVITQYAAWAYMYARDVVGGRFPEGEAVIAQDPKCAADYYNKFYDQFTEHEKVLWLLKV